MHSEARLGLAVSTRSVALGGEVRGSIDLTALRDFSAKSLAVRLYRTADPAPKPGMGATASQQVERKVRLAAGSTRRWEFALAVPADGPPTNNGWQHESQPSAFSRRGRGERQRPAHWFLFALAKHRLRISWTALELNVYHPIEPEAAAAGP